MSDTLLYACLKKLGESTQLIFWRELSCNTHLSIKSSEGYFLVLAEPRLIVALGMYIELRVYIDLILPQLMITTGQSSLLPL